jgi:hypothetical protein
MLTYVILVSYVIGPVNVVVVAVGRDPDQAKSLHSPHAADRPKTIFEGGQWI